MDKIPRQMVWINGPFLCYAPHFEVPPGMTGYYAFGYKENGDKQQWCLGSDVEKLEAELEWARVLDAIMGGDKFTLCTNSVQGEMYVWSEEANNEICDPWKGGWFDAPADVRAKILEAMK